MHNDFRAKVGDIIKRFNESGSSEELSNDVKKTIVRWLVNHIQYEDKKISDHIRRVTAFRERKQ